MALPVTFVAGDVLEAAQLNSNFTYLEGVGGLQLVKTQTIGTTVASVTVTDAFSATYENYKIIVSGGASSANCYLGFKLGASTASYYEFMFFGEFSNSTVLGANTNNGTSFIYFGGGEPAGSLSATADVLGPQLAKYTRYSTGTSYQSGVGSGFSSGVHRVSTAYTDFTLTPNTGTITGGTIYVYGYAKS